MGFQWRSKSRYNRRRSTGHVRSFCRQFSQRWKRIRYKKRSRIMIGILAGVVSIAVVLILYHIPSQAFKESEQTKLESDNISMEIPEEKETSQKTLPTSAPTTQPTPVPTPDPTLMEGMESEKVETLQTRLMDLGFLDLDEPTQYYGPATNYAIKLFQRQHDLDQDGVCGPKTLEIIYTKQAKMYTLLEGTKGNDVDLLQERLCELGYLDKQTGYYGTETIEAVKAFQKRNDIGADGKTGQVTLDLIYSADARPTKELEKQVRRKGTIQAFLASAESQLGKPYIWGASGPNSFDCSGLVTYCLRQAGSSTGRLNAAGFSKNSRWEKISSIGNMQIGDIIFFTNSAGSRVGHTGIYIGDGMMIDASSANGKIVKRSCQSSYWQSHFVCARRPW